ncbi:hypothetical protein [Paraflavitalea speifideaquila]|uniref:hypothetical protein n=1 Tax=Paraflavitalea speifideaquila TaxID=3076558 RepID=UPI0028EBD519|nr:hypothetical protein [Paraflavitalea speifideiaquila]
MTATEALITAARRYCQVNHNYWADKYAKERTGNDYPYTYTDNEFNLFPRYNMLFAILDRVEVLVGQNHLDSETCRQELKTISLEANSPFTAEKNKTAIKAMQEERDKFRDFIEGLTVADLSSIEPLPYRRRLNEEESKQIRQALFEKWNFQGNYWEPLESLSPEPVIFLMKSNISESDYKQIINEIQQHTDNKLFEITEDGSDAEIEFSLFHRNCYETVYCDRSMEWIIYGSHESTIAFAGTWLLDFINQLFADRKDKLNKWEQNW